MSKNEKNDSLLAKWLANDLDVAEKNLLQENESLDDLKFVSDELTSWSLPAVDVEKGLRQLINLLAACPQNENLVGLLRAPQQTRLLLQGSPTNALNSHCIRSLACVVL